MNSTAKMAASFAGIFLACSNGTYRDCMVAVVIAMAPEGEFLDGSKIRPGAMEIQLRSLMWVITSMNGASGMRQAATKACALRRHCARHGATPRSAPGKIPV